MSRATLLPNLLLPPVTDGATGHRKLPLIPLNGHCNKQVRTERKGNMCPLCHSEGHHASPLESPLTSVAVGCATDLLKPGIPDVKHGLLVQAGKMQRSAKNSA